MSEQRVVLITGGSKGIGYAAAERFLQAGDAVIIANRNEEQGKAAVEKLKEISPDVDYFQLDVSDRDRCKEYVKYALDKYGKIDVLFNNAGFYEGACNIFDTDVDVVKELFQIDVLGSLYMLIEAGKAMAETGTKGVIINAGSICGATGQGDEPIGYIMAKNAVHGMTESAATHLAPYGIRCVGIAPAWVETDINLPMLNSCPPLRESACGIHMSGDLMNVSQVAGVVYFLSTEDASGIRGSMVKIDDGETSFKHRFYAKYGFFEPLKYAKQQ